LFIKNRKQQEAELFLLVLCAVLTTVHTGCHPVTNSDLARFFIPTKIDILSTKGTRYHCWKCVTHFF